MNRDKILIALKSLYSIAVGGAAGAVVDYVKVSVQGGGFAQLDFHKVGINAAGGALLALAFHWATPPNKTAGAAQPALPATPAPADTAAPRPHTSSDLVDPK